MNTHKYILVNREPVVEPDLIKWARWFGNGESRRVANTTIDGAGLEVSTVFLGLDHNFFGDGPPVLFETMVFHSSPFKTAIEYDDLMARYCTYDEALKGHQVIVLVVHARLESHRSPGS